MSTIIVSPSLLERAGRLVTRGHSELRPRLAALVDQFGVFRVAAFVAELEAEGWRGECGHEITARARAHRWCGCDHFTEEADRGS